jgi:hypothetical protein
MPLMAGGDSMLMVRRSFFVQLSWRIGDATFSAITPYNSRTTDTLTFGAFHCLH